VPVCSVNSNAIAEFGFYGQDELLKRTLHSTMDRSAIISLEHLNSTASTGWNGSYYSGDLQILQQVDPQKTRRLCSCAPLFGLCRVSFAGSHTPTLSSSLPSVPQAKESTGPEAKLTRHQQGQPTKLQSHAKCSTASACRRAHACSNPPVAIVSRSLGARISLPPICTDRTCTSTLQ